MARAVDMRLKGHTFLLHLANTRERKHLKATTIGQNGAIPAIELMQSSNGFQHLQAWAQIEMIGVAQDDLRLHLIAHIAQMACLYCTCRAHGHEYWSLNRAVAGSEQASTSVAFRVVSSNSEIHRCNFAQKYDFF